MKKARRFTRSQARNSAAPPQGLSRPAGDGNGIRLNKYLAHAGVGTRRTCGDLVKAGRVKVNGAVLANPAYQVQEGDTIEYEGQTVIPSEQPVYLLLNKPRGVIATADDKHDRTTVIDLLDEPDLRGLRLFPVGRLDRETTGLLLITNDGDLTQRLTHPRHEVAKVYQAGLDRPFAEADLEELRAGFSLDDGPFATDWARYVRPDDPRTVSLQIHIGRNRIVRRAFAHLGYTVEKLDRTGLAGLTKKHLPRGFYRFLQEDEVRRLKYFQN